MSTLTVNATLLRLIVAEIERDPRLWDQNKYTGTSVHGRTYCLAGFALKVTGLDVAKMCAEPGGTHRVHEKARNLLGLTRGQAARLFVDWNDGDEHPTVDALKRYLTTTTGVTFP